MNRSIFSFGVVAAVMAATFASSCRDQSKSDEGAKIAATTGPQPSLDESALSKEMATFRDAVLAAKDQKGVAALLDKVEAEVGTYAPEVKFVAAQLAMLKPFRSFIYRATPIVANTRITHNGLLYMLRQASPALNVFLPTEQWKAAFNYVVEPFAPLPQRWNTLAEVQDFLIKTVLPQLDKTIASVDAVVQSNPNFVIDNRMFYGTASFADNRDRFIRVQRPDVMAVLAGLHASRAGLLTSCAYNLDHYPKIADKIARLAGMDAMMPFDDIQGMTMLERTKILKDPAYGSLFTLRQAGQQYMTDAFASMRKSAALAKEVWQNVKGRPANEYLVLNSARLVAWTRPIEESFQNMDAMLAGPTTLRSMVTGETINVNLPNLFQNPPADLKALLPTAFVTAQNRTVEGASIHNPEYGTPTSWNTAAFAPYFTGTDNLFTAARIMGQSWAGWNVGIPILAFAM